VNSGQLTLRAPKDLIERFEAAVKRADPDLTLALAFRSFMRWYLREGALCKLPPSEAGITTMAGPGNTIGKVIPAEGNTHERPVASQDTEG
jgi:hypothetical protein